MLAMYTVSRGQPIAALLCDTNVIPGWFLPIRVAKECSGVVGDHQRDAAEPMDLVAERAQRPLVIEERAGGDASHSDYHLWFHQRNLPV